MPICFSFPRREHGGIVEWLATRTMPRPPVRVLVVDAFDEREMYAEALRNSGMRVFTAATTSAARSAVRRHRFDVVIQGSVFADGSAADLAAEFRRSRRLKGVPLIVLSGFTDAPRVASMQQSGCDAILLKPCLPDDLLREILRLLKRRRSASDRGDPIAS